MRCFGVDCANTRPSVCTLAGLVTAQSAALESAPDRPLTHLDQAQDHEQHRPGLTIVSYVAAAVQFLYLGFRSHGCTVAGLSSSQRLVVSRGGREGLSV